MTPSTSRRGWRWVLPRAALAIGAAAMSVVALEGAGRLYLRDAFISDLPIGRPDKACAQPDAKLGWINLPNTHARVDAPLFTHWLQINSKGLRDTEHSYVKPPGILRIALLGDSLAWGWGVDNGNSFADLIERDLGPNVEVINFGVPGYSTDQELMTLEGEGMRYDPDIVLLCFLANDVPGNHEREYQGRVKPRFRKADGDWVLEPCPPPRSQSDDERAFSLVEWLYWHSALLQAIRPPDAEKALAHQEVRAENERARNAASGGGPPTARRGVNEQIQAYCDEVADSESVTFALLRKLSDFCRQRELPLAAFSIAHHHDQYLYWVDFPRPPPTESGLVTRLSERLAETGRKLGFHTFSVDQAMYEETGKGNVLTCGDAHLNEQGNRVVAQRIVVELRPIVDRVRAGTYSPPERP